MTDNPQVPRRCFYEVLEVERDATDAEIKQSYRKLALVWHPDKNPDNAATADERFKEIQNAYAILSEPNERAWYDSHRESILRGGDGTGEDEDEGLNLWQYFMPTSFKGYGDDENGFYSVYRGVFANIAALEGQLDLPTFGTSESSDETVEEFYSFWRSFVTQRSFAWADKYNTLTAPQRRVKRLMEKENKKERDRRRRSFTELVRQLTMVIRGRDKRVLAALQRKKAAEEERLAKVAAEQQKREAEKAKLRAQWTPDDSDFDWEQFEWTSPEEEPVEPQLELFCAVCRKPFKSERQWLNHKRSKGHRDRVAQLEAVVALDPQLPEAPELDDLDNEESFLEEESLPGQPERQGKKKKKKNRKKNVFADPLEAAKLVEDNATSDTPNDLESLTDNLESLADTPDTPTDDQSNTSQDTIENGDKDEETKPKKKLKAKEKAKLRAARRAAKSLTCNVCHQTFDTRNQLFQHVSTEGHALAK